MRPYVWLVLSPAFILGALLLRLHGLDDPPLTFHPTRQYRSAIIARACYHDGRDEVPETIRRAAAASRAMQPAAEPPLLELIACSAYRLVGEERLAIPRAFSAIVWVLAGVPLAVIIRRGASPGATTLGLSIYLFAPYGVVASRAFQPDPLMTAGALVTLWLLVRDGEQNTAASFAAAAAAMGITLVVKPMSVFLLMPGTLGLAAARVGAARALLNRRVIMLLTFALLPAVVLYGYSTIAGTLARDQWNMRFVPSLLDTAFFWSGWLAQIRRVFGLPIWIAGVAGALFARDDWMKALLASLWAGYALFAVAFTYHMSTHDYYHLPFVPVAALGAAMTANAILDWLSRWLKWSALEAVSTALALVLAVAWSMDARPRLEVAVGTKLRDFEAIGELCAHDTRVLFLDREYGYPLMYHAAISGDAWPSSDDLEAEALGGAPVLTAVERFARDFEDYSPRYFVATDLTSLDAQPDLQELLRARATQIASTSTYRVYRFLEP